jgi:hypothetical protein
LQRVTALRNFKNAFRIWKGATLNLAPKSQIRETRKATENREKLVDDRMEYNSGAGYIKGV